MPRFECSAFPASASSLQFSIHFNHHHNPRMIRTSSITRGWIIDRLVNWPFENQFPPAPCNHAPRTLGRHHAFLSHFSPQSDISVKLSAIFPFAIRSRDSIRSRNPLLDATSPGIAGGDSSRSQAFRVFSAFQAFPAAWNLTSWRASAGENARVR
ncbi:hypothetical protein DL98DRAFT_125974 [Cadophora sp. DSE1049]|nr:hypothetical protein DL98DRAFT_125974 [Cadophora sp. DSE1049]